MRDAKDASGKVGKHVDLPLTLGGKKEGKDKNGELPFRWPWRGGRGMGAASAAAVVATAARWV